MRQELTDRERQVLSSLAAGKRNKEVAAALGLSIRSVENYRERLMLKSGCSSTFQLAVWATRQQYV
jgi:DNA-binding NarL/FixJ family response regulator